RRRSLLVLPDARAVPRSCHWAPTTKSPPGVGPGEQRRLGPRQRVGAYDPSMDSSSASAAQNAADVAGALAPRTDEISTDVYQLIVDEIPELRTDIRVLALLSASVAENVATVLHVLQHGIEVGEARAGGRAGVRPPAGAAWRTPDITAAG